MQVKQVSYQGKPLHYRSKGEGSIIVLLHGFGEEGSIWQNQFNLFPDYKLLVPDLPGSGESELIDDMSMEGLAEAIKAVVENEWQDGQEKKCTLIGHSMGGYFALAFAEKYPEALNAFGLFHSTAYADNEEKKETRRKGIAFIEKNGAFEFLKTSTPNLYAPQTKEKSPALIDEHLASVRNFSAAALVRYYEAMMQRPDRTEVLKSSTVPVLFVMGRHDNAVPLEDALKQCHLPALAHVHLLEGSGHMGMKEEVERTNEILSAFIKF